MTNKLLLLTGAITLGCAFAHATDLHWGKDSSSSDLNTPANWSEAPSEINRDDVCWFKNSGRIAMSLFPADTLYVGYDSTDGKLRLKGSGTATVTNLIWNSGTIYGNTGDTNFKLGGSVCVVGSGSHTFYVSNNSQNLEVLADVTSDDSTPVVTIGMTPKSKAPTLETMLAGSKNKYTLSGSWAGYKGAINAIQFGPVIFAQDYPLGDPDTEKDSALTLQTNAGIAFDGNLAQSANRSIEIVGDQAYFLTWAKVANAYAVQYPIIGTGALIKEGVGTVTLDCDYSAGDIVVTNGALVITAAATISDAVRTVTVHEGCTLTLKQELPATTTVDCKEGGTVIYDYDVSAVVEYDGDNTTVPLDFTMLADDKIPTNVSLSTAIMLPFTDAKRLEMIKLSDASALLAEDFMDVTAKTAGLPFTSFEIEERDGFRMLMLVASKPVAVSVADFTGTVGINGGEGYWSPIETVAVPGWDYLLTNKVTTTGGALEAFAGDALTAHNVTISQKNKPELCISNLFVSGSVNFTANGGTASAPLKLSGDKWTFVDTNATLTVTPIKGSSRYNQDLAAPLAGAGNLVLNVKEAGAKLYCRLSGDNSEFTGTITTACAGKGLSWENPGISVRPASSEALGGMTGWDKITLTDYGLLHPTEDLTLGEADRGWFFDNGGFDIPEGVTLTFREKFKMSTKAAGGDMAKLGEGTLALGGDANLSKTNKKKFYVYGGAVKILADEAVEHMNFVMTNDTSIVLGAETANGIFGTVKPMAEGDKINVTVEGVSDIPAAGIPICTVSTNNVDLTDVLVVQRAPGLGKPELVKERVTVDKTEYDRYSYKVYRSGLIILIQ